MMDIIKMSALRLSTDFLKSGGMLIIILSFITYTHGIQWLSLSRISALSVIPPTPDPNPTHCDQLHHYLVNQQIRFCRDHPAFMPAVTDGANYAIDECQFQFRTRRWNCSTLNDPFRQNLKKKARKSKRKKKEHAYGSNKIPIKITKPTPITNTSLESKPLKPTGQEANSINALIKEPVPDKGNEVLPAGDLTKKARQDAPFKPRSQVRRTKRRGRKRKKNRLKKKHMYQKDQRRKSRGTLRPHPVVPEGTREAAFVHAISSAGVAHAITRKCTSGLLSECGCDLSVRGVTKDGFQWQGCSDNVAYGISLSKRFVDARDLHQVRRAKRKPHRGRRKRKVAKALMNLHNNEAGRRLIESNMKVNCKCHGVSGSCEIKTCWKSMPTFREIGEYLKVKFDGATEMKVEVVGGRPELQPNQQFFKPPSEVDLVYLAKSPEYCERDIYHGILGTQGRRCNKGSHSLDGCDLLCCGRGYSTAWQNGTERCNCKFHWCCFVKCNLCHKSEEIHTCN